MQTRKIIKKVNWKYYGELHLDYEAFNIIMGFYDWDILLLRKYQLGFYLQTIKLGSVAYDDKYCLEFSCMEWDIPNHHCIDNCKEMIQKNINRFIQPLVLYISDSKQLNVQKKFYRNFIIQS